MSGRNVWLERRYRTGFEGSPKTVRAIWYAPEPRGVDWICPFLIEGEGFEPVVREAWGVDAVQALLLAMQAVSSRLYIHEPPIYWHRPDDDLGLPVSEPIADLRDARTK